MRALLLAALCVPSLLQATATQAQGTGEERELKQLQQNIDRIKRELGSTRQQRSEVAGQLEQLEVEIGKVQESLRALGEGIQSSEQELGQLQQQAAALQDRRQAQVEQVQHYMRSAQRAGRSTTLKLLLSQDDPALASRMLRYYRYLGSARLAQVNDFRDTLQSMTKVSTDVRSASQELALRRESLLAEQSRLAQRQTERQALLDELDVNLSSGTSALAGLERQRDDLERLLDELRSAVADLDAGGADTPFAARKGQMAWPVQGRVLHAFGSRHELGDLTREGITLGAAAGTPVKAIHHGRVVFADWLGNSGQLLIIDHGDGYMTLHGHNQELLKREGDWVAAGETIATVGNTGGQRDSALYFEIRRNGKAENPVSWCVPR